MFLTPAQLAAHFNVSERTITRMVADGCPSILVGRRRRFDLATVTAWTTERAEECRPAKTQTVAGTPRYASAVVAFTDASRKVQVRVTPSGSKQS